MFLFESKYNKKEFFPKRKEEIISVLEQEGYKEINVFKNESVKKLVLENK